MLQGQLSRLPGESICLPSRTARPGKHQIEYRENMIRLLNYFMSEKR